MKVSIGRLKKLIRILSEDTSQLDSDILVNDVDYPLCVAPSPVHGLGVFSLDFIPRGVCIGISHVEKVGGGFSPTELGRFHNHSEEANVGNVLRDGVRSLFAIRNIETGEELVADYQQQPDLQQPIDFWLDAEDVTL